MNFISVRIITADIRRLVAFYEHALGVQASWLNEEFAELQAAGATLAIGSTRTLGFFSTGDLAQPAANRSVFLEFMVEDVDRHFEQLRPEATALVQAPTTMPWGNRSLLIRDPDGNLVNFFSPVTEMARKRFGLQ
ncbi:VOC family protein [Mitsuaria sp. GD03876]|uniref:VOC family protein n=1 Tax=Mitsuaria sp. GD03876 TaxID=2975399 RepID=UPI002447F7B7|nr:VOC family protein [Mitsuaria sp. GD03876]MDH0866537.1 VOC family protein [Mitsuaria sp. GD03876]